VSLSHHRCLEHFIPSLSFPLHLEDKIIIFIIIIIIIFSSAKKRKAQNPAKHFENRCRLPFP
jgi:hypothetical protein